MATIRDIQRMTYPAFVALPNGTEIYNHGANECVAVANQYHVGVLELPLPQGFSSAYEWWTRRGEKREIYENYDFSRVPEPGALFVAKGGIYDPIDGHIGQVYGVRDGGFTTLEQNTGKNPPQRYLYRHFRIRDANVYGFLIPKKNPAAPATPSTPSRQEEDDAMKPTVHVRLDNNKPGEYMLAHPAIGNDLKPGEQRVDGKHTVFRGYMVTTDMNAGHAWARTYARGIGGETSRTDRAGYIAIQAELTRVSVEVAG